MSTVYFLPANDASTQVDMVEGLPRLWDAAGFAGCFREKDLAAVKQLAEAKMTN